MWEKLRYSVPILKLHVKRFSTKLFKEIYAIIRSTETDPKTNYLQSS